MKKVLSLLSLALLVASCAPKAEPIDYGKEECAFCKMTIVSPQFASEVVTQKSKAFKYDAVECMLQAPQEDQIALHLVCDYLKEGNLIDATKATYLWELTWQLLPPVRMPKRYKEKKEENSMTGKVSKLSSKDISTLPLLTMTTCMITN